MYGCRFKAKKGAAGDTKGSSKLEPYAYWPLDRKLLNRCASCLHVPQAPDSSMHLATIREAAQLV